MKVDIEFIEAGFFFNKESKFHPERPLLNVTWVKDDGNAFCAISSIESILWPNLFPEYATVPEIVRIKVVNKYGEKLREFSLEEKK